MKIKYLAGYPISITLCSLCSICALFLPDDADWITSEKIVYSFE